MCLEPYELGDVVFLRESRDLLVFVLVHAVHKVVGHAGIEDSRLTGKNVNVEDSVHVCGGLQVQPAPVRLAPF